MTLKKRLQASALAFVCTASIAGTAAAEAPPALSSHDAKAYAAAFEATDRGDFIAAQMQSAAVQDHSLEGYLSFHALMHPTAHVAAFDELSGWLAKFRDLPVADRIFALASKRKTDPAADAGPKPMDLGDGPRIANPVLSDKARRGREAFFGGDVKRALSYATASGDRWIIGLASYRLKDFGTAREAFADLARDGECDAWMQSAAAYWASRSAGAEGDVEAAAKYLRAAARNSETFYGMVAGRQLKLARDATSPASGDPVAGLILAAYAAPAAGASADLTQFVATDPRAHRAAALAQIGRGSDAIQELRAGLALARTPTERANWQALTTAMGTALADRYAPPRASDLDYPAPDLQPAYGFTQDKALVYAIVRQESRFNTQAVSRPGATGLMQLMPASAALVTGNQNLRRDPSPLYEPAYNLRVGQDYFAWLLDRGVGHNLMRAVAAYNAGPGAVLKTTQILGDDADPLLLMECLPAQETRTYVQRVMAGYWTYRKMWGKPTATLDALAAGARVIDERLDAVAPLVQPGSAPTQLAAEAIQVGMR